MSCSRSMLEQLVCVLNFNSIHSCQVTPLSEELGFHWYIQLLRNLIALHGVLGFEAVRYLDHCVFLVQGTLSIGVSNAVNFHKIVKLLVVDI